MSAQEMNSQQNPEDRVPAFNQLEPEPFNAQSGTRWIAGAFLVTAFFVGTLAYRLIMHAGLGHTSLMFIGIPGILALLLVLAPRPESAKGSILRGITLALLIIAPLVGEGYLCILFASPLFLGVGLLIGAIIDLAHEKGASTLSCVVLLLPLSLEGVVPQLTPSRAQSVEVTQVVNASADEVQITLAQNPAIHTPLPRFLRIGFPRPLEAHGSGLGINTVHVIHFTGAEGDPPGDLVMRVTVSEPGHVRFDTVSDSSKLTQWICWKSSDVRWRSVDAQHTAVTWRITFDRQLDPFWYFAPWEHVAVREAAKYLIAANATPQR